MDLNTVEAVLKPMSRGELPAFRDGDAWLAGGTWLFSEPQRHLRRLIDLSRLGWSAIEVSREGLSIAATCPIAELEAFEPPSAWLAGRLIHSCCHAFWASFKIWNTATVGGNLCLALPAGPMIALAAALEGTCRIWTPNGDERQMPAEDFVSGPQRTVLRPGELLRGIEIAASSLQRRAAFRQTSLTPLGRSAALLIGTRAGAGAFRLTVTAATPRPIVLAFDKMPSADDLRDRLDDILPADKYYDDLHGSPLWRQHLTQEFAEEIRVELAS